MKKRKFPILKTFIICVLLCSALFIAFRAPEAAESFLPAARTVTAEKYSYCPAVSAGGKLISVNGVWQAVVAVNEAEIAEVSEGQYVSLSGAAFPDGVFSGRVSLIGDTAYTVTKTSVIPETVVDVTVEITEGDLSLLRSGYSVTAAIRTGEERAMLTLPYAAIDQDDEGGFVYVLENGRTVRRGVVTGAELSDRAEIVSGVGENDRVILDPQEYGEGETVRMS